jgi:hypothetical protein
MGKKRKQTTVTDWAEIPDTMEPQITNMTMETMGEDWVAGPPEEYDCDLALYKAPNDRFCLYRVRKGHYRSALQRA